MGTSSLGLSAATHAMNFMKGIDKRMVKLYKLTDLILNTRKEYADNLVWANKGGKEYFIVGEARLSTKAPFTETLLESLEKVWGLVEEETGKYVSKHTHRVSTLTDEDLDAVVRAGTFGWVMTQELRWLRWEYSEDPKLPDLTLTFRGGLNAKIAGKYAVLLNWPESHSYEWCRSSDTLTISTQSGWEVEVPITYVDKYGNELSDFRQYGIAPEDTGHSPY